MQHSHRSKGRSGRPGKFSPSSKGGVKKRFYTAKTKDGTSDKYPDAHPPSVHAGKPKHFKVTLDRDDSKKRFGGFKSKKRDHEMTSDARPSFHKEGAAKNTHSSFKRDFKSKKRDHTTTSDVRPSFHKEGAAKNPHGGLKRDFKSNDRFTDNKSGVRSHFSKSGPRKNARPSSFRDKGTLQATAYKPAGDNVLIWGLHAARAAWLNPKRRCSRLWLTETGKTTFETTLTEANEELLKRPDLKMVERHELDHLTPPGSVHQGILIEVAPLHEPSLHEVISGDNPPEILMMLDQVTDPHNVGAILRSAAAFGAGAVIMTERNAPIMTGVQAKSASGATEHVPHIHVVNLARALDELQQAGYWCVGLAEEGEKELSALDLSGRTVLVLGAEGDGLRQLTRKKCDELARLPTGGPIGSLNVSNAAAVALYEIRRQKNKFQTASK